MTDEPSLPGAAAPDGGGGSAADITEAAAESPEPEQLSAETAVGGALGLISY